MQCHDNPDADALAGGYGIYCYMPGKEGDYLAARVEEPRDIYVIEKRIFHKTYEQI